MYLTDAGRPASCFELAPSKVDILTEILINRCPATFLIGELFMCANRLLLDCSCHSLHVYGRATSKEIQLGGYKIPKGVTLFLSLGGIHTSKLNYTDPDKFWPVSAAHNIT